MALNRLAVAELRIPQGPSIAPSLDGQLFCNRVSIGGISLGLWGTSQADVRLNSGLEIFGGDSPHADLEVYVRWTPRLTGCKGEKVFESGGVWSLFREDADWVFDFNSPSFGPHPYKRLRVREDDDFRVADLAMNASVDGRGSVGPLDYPADELLFTNYLARHGLGVEVHGCGLVDEGKAYLFLGHSGAGKSTTARMWQSLRKAEILSDDRVILRMHEGELWMYGTPWHGEAAYALPVRAKLDRIFILRHAAENRISELSPALAAGELFARSFPPFHSESGLERTVAFLHNVVERVPCYDFAFVPDESAIRQALEFHD